MTTPTVNTNWTAANHSTYVTLTNGGTPGDAAAGDAVLAVIGTKSSVQVDSADVDGQAMTVDYVGTDVVNSRRWYVCRQHHLTADPETITILFTGTDTDAYSLAYAVNTTTADQVPRHFDIPGNRIEGLDGSEDWAGWTPSGGWSDGAVGIEWSVSSFTVGVPGSTVWAPKTGVWDDAGTPTFS
jgi:hypothetical protein